MASSRRGWIIWIWMVRCSLYYVEWVDVFGGFLCPLYKNKLCVIIVCFSCVEIGHVIVGRLRMNVILRTKQRIQSYSPPPLFLDSYPDLFRLTRCWLHPLIRSTSAESYGRLLALGLLWWSLWQSMSNMYFFCSREIHFYLPFARVVFPKTSS